MTRALSVARKWFSLKGEVQFTDDRGELAYHAAGEFGPVVPTWTITKDGVPVARVRKKAWSLTPVWDIEGEPGAFRVQRKVMAWTRRYQAVGGPFDGALAAGSFSDLKFEMRHDGRVLARASGELLSLNDRHRVEVLDGDEIFVVVMMLVVMLDRANESAAMMQG